MQSEPNVAASLQTRAGNRTDLTIGPAPDVTPAPIIIGPEGVQNWAFDLSRGVWMTSCLAIGTDQAESAGL